VRERRVISPLLDGGNVDREVAVGGLDRERSALFAGPGAEAPLDVLQELLGVDGPAVELELPGVALGDDEQGFGELGEPVGLLPGGP
jgi:hypothetical protein